MTNYLRQSSICQKKQQSFPPILYKVEGLVGIEGLWYTKNEVREMFSFNHFNFNVSDLDKSLAFYKEALGLEPVGERKEAADGSFVIVYLGDKKTDFRLELTWLRDHPQKYDLGECEFHLALRAEDFEAAHKKHREMGCICFENPAMGIYFISDPDGYWLEVIPAR